MEDIELDYTDAEWEEILAGRGRFLALPEVERDYIQRWDDLKALQDHYPLFKTFMTDCFKEVKGFDTDALQRDIADFIQSPIRLKMVQAQRGQAKSMIIGAYVVWRLIHTPSTRTLIISAGAQVADEIAKWVKLIIDYWDILECMRPDKQHGDRTSAVAFDIHWMLKGPDKSPSVRSLGITSNLQGRRADLLIPDDIESSQNGLTPTQRENLLQLSKDFASICAKGDIVYLGTPQSTHSIYNGLADRGYTVRIWPGRFPTLDEEEFYGDKLAPWIKQQMEMMPSLRKGGGVGGQRGQPTSKLIKDEDQLTATEIDQGPAYFDLQYMLNTSTSDVGKFPLKVKNLIILDVNGERGPGALIWLPDPRKRVEHPDKRHELYLPHNVSEEFYEWEGKMIFCDPSGAKGGNDEICSVVSYILHGYVHIPEMIVSRGGFTPSTFENIARMALRREIWTIVVEDNVGNGAFAVMLRPVLKRIFLEAGYDHWPAVVDFKETTNKEMRMIGILEPILARHRLVISPEVLRYDIESTEKYSTSERGHFSLLNQMSQVTPQRGCLVHDDRLDALAGAVRHWLGRMSVIEQEKMAQENKEGILEVLNRFLDKPKEKGGILSRRTQHAVRRKR